MQGYMEVVEHFKESVHNLHAIDVPIGTTTGGAGLARIRSTDRNTGQPTTLNFLPVISRPLPIPPLD